MATDSAIVPHQEEKDADSLGYSSEDEKDEGFFQFADDETAAADRVEAEAEAAAEAERLSKLAAVRAQRLGELEDERRMAEKPEGINEESPLKMKTKTKKKKKKRKKKKRRNDLEAIRLARNSEAEVKRDDAELQEEEWRGPRKGKKRRPSLEPTPKAALVSEQTTLEDREWENELARSILSLYQGTVAQEKEKGKEKRQEKGTASPKYLPSLKSKSATSKEGGMTRRRLRTERPPGHIWFAGSGALPAVWCGLSEASFCRDAHRLSSEPDPARCTHRLCARLRELERTRKFETYADSVRELLRALSRRSTHDRAEAKQAALQRESLSGGAGDHQTGAATNAHTCALGPGAGAPATRRERVELRSSQRDYLIDLESLDPTLLADGSDDYLERMMWRQLVVSCNLLGVKACEAGKFGTALKLFKMAEDVVEQTSAIEGGSAFVGKIKRQLKGFIWDSLAFYYYKRRKPNAAALYSQKAMRAHVALEQWEHVAKCHLHCGAVLALMGKHEDAVKCLAQVLQMVEDERLQVGGSNAQKICMVAVTYHNIAVEQLTLRRPAEACVSSQNARRLARLSLSYANRWINCFERTHHCALERLSKQHSYLDKPKRPDANHRQKQMRKSEPAPDVRTSLKNERTRKFYANIVDAAK